MTGSQLIRRWSLLPWTDFLFVCSCTEPWTSSWDTVNTPHSRPWSSQLTATGWTSPSHRSAPDKLSCISRPACEFNMIMSVCLSLIIIKPGHTWNDDQILTDFKNVRDHRQKDSFNPFLTLQFSERTHPIHPRDHTPALYNFTVATAHTRILTEFLRIIRWQSQKLLSLC